MYNPISTLLTSIIVTKGSIEPRMLKICTRRRESIRWSPRQGPQDRSRATAMEMHSEGLFVVLHTHPLEFLQEKHMLLDVPLAIPPSPIENQREKKKLTPVKNDELKGRVFV